MPWRPWRVGRQAVVADAAGQGLSRACLRRDGGLAIERTHDLLIEAEDPAPALNRHERDLARLAGLEAHRGAGRDVQPAAPGYRTVELQRLVVSKKW